MDEYEGQKHLNRSLQRGRRGPLENRSYLNDDYTKHSGPDYHEPRLGSRYDEFDRGQEERRRGRENDDSGAEHPGVSGKDRETGSWFNQKQYATQKSFIGKGPKGYRRDDQRIYEDVCQALWASPAVDARQIEVSVSEGVVSLSGQIDSRQAKKKAERIIEHLPGVQDVLNQLKVEDAYNEIISRGPGSVTQNDLGL
jgi:hypothetical protein